MTRMRFQTGAVKQGRNTDSQAARIGGTNRGSGAAAPGRFDAIAVVESGRTDSARVPPPGRDNYTDERDLTTLPTILAMLDAKGV